MRGTVTLAAALALPTGQDGGAPFPYRDLILVAAFGVVLGTLVLQGLTLRPLLLHLRLEDDGSVEREVRLARIEALRAALTATDGWPGAETAALVRQSYALQLRRAEEELAKGGADGTAETPPAVPSDADARVVHAATGAQRRRLVALRADGTIGDAAFQRLEEELDWAELGWAQVLPPEHRAHRP
jgi:CPA1 family monovalent cation:H+ antiporter